MSDLGTWDIQAAWHEAVSLVRQVALCAAAVPEPVAVEPAHIWLSLDGTVRLEPPVGGSRGPLVPALATLLARLLPATAPAALRALADSTHPDVRNSSPQEFIAALTFFARPDDLAELKHLCARALEARDASERTRALQALTDRARHAPTALQVGRAWSRKHLLQIYLAGAAAGAAVAVLAWATGAWPWSAAPHPPSLVAQEIAAGVQAVAQGVQHSVAQRVRTGLGVATAFVKGSLDGAPDTQPGPASDVAPPKNKRATRRVSTEARDTTAPGRGETVVGPVTSSGAGGVLPRSDVPSGGSVQRALAAAPHGVYGASDPDVIPPALVRAQMPTGPLGGVPIERPGVLEIVVSEDGQVVSAKLIPLSNRHQDRMMISAAKAWRFAPARRNGQAVPYRLHMAITW